mmetsp:Transcript_34709/g.88847  ORF Transcript_34709/g.88847 Transcript_34709/m.88847 type:complete len:300 (-) Transcript_34709:354-1253(-)
MCGYFAHLRSTQLNVAAVKVQAKFQLRCLAAIPGANDDPTTLARAVNGRLQGPHIAADFYGYVKIPVRRVPSCLQSAGVQHRSRSHPPCNRCALRVQLHCYHILAPNRAAQDGSDEQADETLAVDSHPLSDDGGGLLNKRQSRLDGRKVASILRREPRWDHDGRVGSDNSVASVGSKRKHQTPHPLPSIDPVSNRLHAPHQAVAILQWIRHCCVLHVLNRRIQLGSLIEVPAKHLELRPTADHAPDRLEQQLPLLQGGHVGHIDPDLLLGKKLENLSLPPSRGPETNSCGIGCRNRGSF